MTELCRFGKIVDKRYVLCYNGEDKIILYCLIFAGVQIQQGLTKNIFFIFCWQKISFLYAARKKYLFVSFFFTKISSCVMIYLCKDFMELVYFDQ